MDLQAPTDRARCCFGCGSALIAVAIDAVAEVIEVDRLVRVPLSRAPLLGMAALRRDVVPVVELAAQPHPEPRPGERIAVLILRGEAGLWALRINRTGVLVTHGPLRPLASPAPGSSTARWLGTVDREGTVYHALDLVATARAVRSEVDASYSLVHRPAAAPVLIMSSPAPHSTPLRGVMS